MRGVDPRGIGVLVLLGLAIPTAAETASDPGTPPRNPYLADAASPIVHYDPAQTDATAVAGPSGTRRLSASDIARVPSGPLNAAYLGPVSYPDGSQVVWVNSPNRVAKLLVSGGAFREIATLPLPGQRYWSPSEIEDLRGALEGARDEAALLRVVGDRFPLYLERVATRSGIYSMLDADGDVYILTGGRILVVGDSDPLDPYSTIEVKRSFSIPGDALSDWPLWWKGAKAWWSGRMRESSGLGVADLLGILSDFPLCLNMTYDGHVVFGTVSGAIGIVDRGFSKEPELLHLRDGLVTNSFPVDPEGGIYVATERALHKVVWTGSELSDAPADGAWSASYDRYEGDLGGVRSGSSGTGSTPSLMGFGENADRLVVITDGSRRMKLVAFWRDRIAEPGAGDPSAQIAGAIEVSLGDEDPDTIQSEQSVAVQGYGAFVVNNAIGEPLTGGLETTLVSGVTRPGPVGVARYTWLPEEDRWSRSWARSDIASPSTVPLVSSGSSQVYFNRFVDGAWEITGLDWDTGSTRTRLALGASPAYNGAYTVIQLLPGGDILYGALLGPVRLRVGEPPDGPNHDQHAGASRSGPLRGIEW